MAGCWFFTGHPGPTRRRAESPTAGAKLPCRPISHWAAGFPKPPVGCFYRHRQLWWVAGSLPGTPGQPAGGREARRRGQAALPPNFPLGGRFPQASSRALLQSSSAVVGCWFFTGHSGPTRRWEPGCPAVQFPTGRQVSPSYGGSSTDGTYDGRDR